MRIINKIIIHCTDTPEGRRVNLNEVKNWHKARGFRTIGYHYLVHIDGSISRGRKEEEIGAHCKGHNDDSIGIAYVGGKDRYGNAKDTRTKAQKHAINIIIEKCKDIYGDIKVHCHNEFSNKACPSFKIEQL